ncbi:MAG: aldehyde dehydrogenase family protein [Phycisphaerales bacterium]|nr:aldehyde dehydrogenase family protein [Phycisphaerales bacterium]
MSTRDLWPMFLAGRPVERAAALSVENKFSGERIGAVSTASNADIDSAIKAAWEARRATRALAGHERRDILQRVVDGLSKRSEEFAQLLTLETGKCVREARGEVARAIDTFRLASEESTRIGGEFFPLDISPRAADSQCVVGRFPAGVCSFITPFNFPLNLAAHKIAPAIAAGCPWILKPSPNTPLTSMLLGELLADTSLPEGGFSILVCDNDAAAPLVEDERISVLSFTGSTRVGWGLRERAGRKRVLLELGGNAACIVDRDVDLDHVAERLTFGAFYQAGQSCISVQRVLAHREILDSLRTRLIAAAAVLKMGDPREESTTLGPLISQREAERVEQWIAAAVAAGARVLCGGRRHGRFAEATWMENVAADAQLDCEEVFGPVATLRPFDDFDEALHQANASRYGLQAGVFTNNLMHAMRAFRELDVGGVIINDVPSFRVDNMPYGGVKDSGAGREGVRYMIEELTERKALVLRS